MNETGPRHAKRIPRELGGAARYIYESIKLVVTYWRKSYRAKKI